MVIRGELGMKMLIAVCIAVPKVYLRLYNNIMTLYLPLTQVGRGKELL